MLKPEETAAEEILPLLGGRLFSGYGLIFLLVSAAGFGLLLRGLLLIGFRGFIAHVFDFLPALTLSRNRCFPARADRLLIGEAIVNDGWGKPEA